MPLDRSLRADRLPDGAWRKSVRVYEWTGALTGRISHQTRAWFNSPWHLGLRT